MWGYDEGMDLRGSYKAELLLSRGFDAWVKEEKPQMTDSVWLERGGEMIPLGWRVGSLGNRDKEK